MIKGSRYLHLIVGLLAISGCATSSSPTGEQATSVITNRISRIDAVEGSRGTSIHIQSEGKLKYALFQKEQPARLLLDFPDAKMDPGVQPRNINLANVSSLFPMENPGGGSKLEIVLPESRAYDIQERPDGMELIVLSDTPEKGRVLEHIKDLVINRSESGTNIQIVGSEHLPDPESYRLTDPPRLVVDLVGVTNEIAKTTIEINSPEVSRLNVGSTAEKTRIVFDLADPQVTFRIDRQLGSPLIQLSHASIQTTPQAHKGKETAPARASIIPQMETVTFAKEGDEALVRIRADRSDVPVDVKREGSNLVLDFIGVSVPDRLSRRMDVSAFGSTVRAIDTFAEGNNGRIIIRLHDTSAVHNMTQNGQEFLVRLNKAAPLVAGERAAYTGEKITMDFKDIDIQNALKYVTQISQMNLIMSDTVRGTLTMRLEEVPWDQALDLILEAKGLGKVQQNNVLRVAPVAEIQTMDDDRLKSEQSRMKLERMITEMIPVSFADPNDIMTLISSGDEKENTRLLSSRGSVSIDKRTSTLIISDGANNLDKIREMIRKLDKPIPQVLIEARIVEVRRSDNLNMGIKWGMNYKPEIDAKWALSGSANDAANVYNSIPGTILPRASMATGRTANVDLMGGAASNVGLHFGTINPLLDLDVELGAMEVATNGKVVSSPKVLTTNNQAAKINQGVSQPYQTTSAEGTTTTFVDAVLSLEVTPKVAPNGSITLDVKATNNTLGAVVPGSTAPAINKSEVQTKVLVNNGETIVLGGIYTKDSTDGSNGIPGAKDIPFLGWLFKNKSSTSAQSELLIFITPRIVNPT